MIDRLTFVEVVIVNVFALSAVVNEILRLTNIDFAIAICASAIVTTTNAASILTVRTDGGPTCGVERERKRERERENERENERKKETETETETEIMTKDEDCAGKNWEGAGNIFIGIRDRFSPFYKGFR